MQKILILGLTPNLGGTEKVILNLYKHMNKDNFHFDFLLFGDNEKVGFSEDFERLSKNPIIYHNIPRKRNNFILYRKKLKTFFKENSRKYDAIWVNLQAIISIEPIIYAKKYGIKKIIIHSHNAGSNKKLLTFIHKIHRPFIYKHATDFWACSDEAKEWMFPKKIYEKTKWIRNAIDVEKYIFNSNVREQYRKRFDISDKELVIGHIGRIDYQKNQEFIIKIFYEVLKFKHECKLVLVGSGDSRKLKSLAESLGIIDKIKFLGAREDVENLFNMFDVFVFPSRFEGLGVALLEAQANGIPILASDVIPPEVIVNSNYYYLSLSDSPIKWAEKILELQKEKRIDTTIVKKNIVEKGFDLVSETKQVESLLIE